MPANLSADYGVKFIEILRALGVSAVPLCGAMELEGAEREAAPKALNFGKEQILVEAKFFEFAAESPVAEAVLPWMKDALSNVVEVFAAEQAAGLAAVLGATKGIDLLAAPSATTRSGQEVVIEILREVRYPIAWKKDAQTGGWEPSDYAANKVGTTLGALAKVQDADAIEVTLRPEVVEFVGFQDLDAPGLPEKSAPAATKPLPERMLKMVGGVLLPAGHRAKAVFAARKMDTVITVRSGESVLLELRTPPIPEAGKRRVFALVAVEIRKPERGPAGDVRPVDKE